MRTRRRRSYLVESSAFVKVSLSGARDSGSGESWFDPRRGAFATGPLSHADGLAVLTEIKGF